MVYKRKTLRKPRTLRKQRRLRKTRRRRRIRGGNYAIATVMTLDGLPIVSPKKMTITVPGFGVLSGEDYIKYINK